MAVRGAIFDCDGTLLDSMPMWTDMCVGLLECYGVQDAQRIFLEHESLDMDKKCYWYHEHLGIGASGEALYCELWAMVRQAYKSVTAYEGCAEFLRELRGHGIPCAILSSTPPELVRAALADHDLLQYFDDILFVGDVGRGKEFSDCYVEAARRLGTPRADTWVFEDAPFGVRSAVRAGLPTVAILNDHDGRDERFLATWATVVARSYGALSVQKLRDLSPGVTKVLVVAGSPEPSSPELVARLAAQADFVIAADRGIVALRKAGVVPNVYCGDEDSTDEETCAWAHDHVASIERHPVEKDDTDLGLAIQCARREADRRGTALRLTLTCASGGRPDHMLGVWGLLAQNHDLAPRLAEDGFECRVLSPLGEDTWEFARCEGATVSTIALVPQTVATEKGMRWNLDKEPLALLGDLGISNRVVDTQALVRCDAGVLAVILQRV